jgi:hypothetical protein
MPFTSWYSEWLRVGRSGDRIPVEVRFSAPVQTGPGAHLASCTMGTGSFPGVKSGRGVTLTPHPLLVLWSWKSRAIPLLPLWAVRPVHSISACTRVHFTLLNIFSRLLSEYVLSDRPGKRTEISHVFAVHVQYCSISELRNGCENGVLSGAVVRGCWLMSGLWITSWNSEYWL